jgi:hypothetical protein
MFSIPCLEPDAVFTPITAPISVCNLTLSYGQQATIYVNQTSGSGSWPRAGVCIATQLPNGPPIGQCLPVLTNPPTKNSTDAFIVTTGSACPTAPCTTMSIQLSLNPGGTALVQILQGCATSTCTGVTHVDISSLPSPPSPPMPPPMPPPSPPSPPLSPAILVNPAATLVAAAIIAMFL